MKKLRAVLLIDDDNILRWFTKTLLERMEVVEQVECLHYAPTALDYLAKLSSSESLFKLYLSVFLCAMFRHSSAFFRSVPLGTPLKKSFA